jgi:hypothetical protein
VPDESLQIGDECSECLSTIACVEIKGKMRQCIQDKLRRTHTDETASEISINQRQKKCKNNLKPI